MFNYQNIHGGCLPGQTYVKNIYIFDMLKDDAGTDNCSNNQCKGLVQAHSHTFGQNQTLHNTHTHLIIVPSKVAKRTLARPVIDKWTININS